MIKNYFYLGIFVLLGLSLGIYYYLEICFGTGMKLNTKKEAMDTTDIMQMRLRHLRATCDSYEEWKDDIPTTYYHFYSETNNLLYCSIFKAASTTWFYRYSSWAGVGDTYLKFTKKSPLEIARNKYKILKLSKLRQVFKNATSFIVVREPFERIVSAYRDKILFGHDKLYKIVQAKIFSKYQEKNDALESIKFEAFIKWVIADFDGEIEPDYGNDVHWRPYTELCSPCFFNYSVILKMESYRKDESYLAKKANLSDVIKPLHFNSGKRSGKSTVDYISELPYDLFQRLYEIYKLDFELFGYSAEKYFKLFVD